MAALEAEHNRLRRPLDTVNMTAAEALALVQQHFADPNNATTGPPQIAQGSGSGMQEEEVDESDLYFFSVERAEGEWHLKAFYQGELAHDVTLPNLGPNAFYMCTFLNGVQQIVAPEEDPQPCIDVLTSQLNAPPPPVLPAGASPFAVPLPGMQGMVCAIVLKESWLFKTILITLPYRGWQWRCCCQRCPEPCSPRRR